VEHSFSFYLGGESVSNKLLWQPSDCTIICYDGHCFFAVGNKYDDDDDPIALAQHGTHYKITCLCLLSVLTVAILIQF